MRHHSMNSVDTMKEMSLMAWMYGSSSLVRMLIEDQVSKSSKTLERSNRSYSRILTWDALGLFKSTSTIHYSITRESLIFEHTHLRQESMAISRLTIILKVISERLVDTSRSTTSQTHWFIWLMMQCKRSAKITASLNLAINSAILTSSNTWIKVATAR